jgi:hypothetical protein
MGRTLVVILALTTALTFSACHHGYTVKRKPSCDPNTETCPTAGATAEDSTKPPYGPPPTTPTNGAPTNPPRVPPAR